MRGSEIIQLLSDCANLLRRFEVRDWTRTLEIELQDLKRAYASEGRGYKLRILNDILRLYGGMGSFSDIYICQENNRLIKGDEVMAVNKEFQRLRSVLYINVQAEIAELESKLA